MEPEVLHHVRIAPGCQVAVLGRAEAARSAARQFSLGRGGAKGIEVADTCRGQLVQRLFAAQRAQRKKAAEPGQVQTVQPHRREPGAEACAGGREVPGWYNEGLAQHLSGEGALALRRAPKILEPGFLELSELGGSFARWSDREKVARAYTQSLVLVDGIASTYGERLLIDLCTDAREGGHEGIAAGFERRTGFTLQSLLDDLEAAMAEDRAR